MSVETIYPLAPQGVYWTIQGEGALAGAPMVFIRLAGCDVGCQGCDTDYSVSARDTAREIARLVIGAASSGTEWAWLTGGEPLLYNLAPLVSCLRTVGLKVALATAGHRPLSAGLAVDFLSVSPHSPRDWLLRSGDQVNLVPGLNGLSWTDIEAMRSDCESGFTYRYITPCACSSGSLEECLQWISRYRDWRLGTQIHKLIGLP